MEDSHESMHLFFMLMCEASQIGTDTRVVIEAEEVKCTHVSIV